MYVIISAELFCKYKLFHALERDALARKFQLYLKPQMKSNTWAGPSLQMVVIYLEVCILNSRHCSLCKVPAPDYPDINLALGKPTWQGDTYSNGESSRAVDGNQDPRWEADSCTQTSKQHHSWWAVDLEDTYQLTKVMVVSLKYCKYNAIQVIMGLNVQTLGPFAFNDETLYHGIQ